MTDVTATYGVDVSSFVAGAQEAQDTARATFEQMASSANTASSAMHELHPHLHEVKVEVEDIHEAAEVAGEGLKLLHTLMKDAFEAAGVIYLLEKFKELGEFIKELGGSVVQLRNMSEVLEVTTDQMQALNAAATDVGVSQEQVTRSVERLVIMLVQAREGVGSATEKLHLLGITQKEVDDSNFGTIQILQKLHERILDVNTAHEEQSQLLAVLGPRGALFSEALKKMELGEEGVAKTMREVNGLQKEEVEGWAEFYASMAKAGEATENFAKKSLVALGTAFTAMGYQTQRQKEQMLELAVASGQSAEQIEALRGRLGLVDERAVADSANAAKQHLGSLTATQKELIEKGEAAAKAGEESVTLADLRAIKLRVDAEKQGSAERLAAVKEFYEATVQYYGAGNLDKVPAAYAQMLAEQRAYEARSEALNTQHTTELLKADEQRARAISQSISESGSDLADVKANNEAELESKRESVLGQIALQKQLFDSQFIGSKDPNAPLRQAAGDADFLNQQLAAWNAFYLDKQALTAKDAAEQKKFQTQNAAEADKTTQEINKVTAQAVKQTQNNWESALKPIGGAFDSMISGMVHGTETLHRAMIRLGGQILDIFIRDATEEVIRWIAKEEAKTAATVAGVTTRTAATTAGATTSLLVEGLAAVKFIGIEAYKAAAGAFAAMASIPYVGPALAVAASAAALAAVLGLAGAIKFEKGGLVPNDMLAQLHAGEAVLPRHLSEGLQRMINSGGGGGGGAGGGLHVHVHALDAKSFHDYVHTPAARTAIASAAELAYRRGNVRQR